MNALPTPHRRLSAKDFASFGLNMVAFIKPVTMNGAVGYAIFAADGTPLTVVHERTTAYATVRQHEMEPLSVH